MVNFYLENRVSKKGEAPIRVSIAISGARMVSSSGYSIKPEDWNSEKQEVKPKKENRKKETAYEITRHYPISRSTSIPMRMTMAR